MNEYPLAFFQLLGDDPYADVFGAPAYAEEEAILNDEPVIPILLEETPEPIIYSCPKLDRSVNFGDYITNIDFSRSVSAVVGYDIVLGSIENIQVIEGKASSKLLRAITKYLNDAISTTDITVTDCYIPFKVEV